MGKQGASDFYDYYELEVAQMNKTISSQTGLRAVLIFLMKTTGVFLTITGVVFLLVNYEIIRAQVADAKASDNFDNRTVFELADKDSDGDGLFDQWEDENGLDKNNPSDAVLDGDNDGVNNLIENQFDTNPNHPDTDNDGYFDGEEIRNGNNPKGFGRIDTDGDGLLDWWEEENQLDKNNPDDAEDDFDQDGLTNKEEFLYSANPRERDTDGDGVSDGQEVEKGLSPIEDGSLEDQLKKVDLNDQDQDGLSLEQEIFFGTDPGMADTDEDSFSDYRELTRGYDPLKKGEAFIEGHLSIPSIGVDAPITWSQSTEESEILNQLESGLIHYPGTAIPGFPGNVYITGHSSYYSWSKSSYKDILKNLNKLKLGEEIIFHLKIGDNYSKKVIYEVSTEGEVVTPHDYRIFKSTKDSEVTLVTCWPLGTSWKRMMVKGKLKGELQP